MKLFVAFLLTLEIGTFRVNSSSLLPLPSTMKFFKIVTAASFLAGNTVAVGKFHLCDSSLSSSLHVRLQGGEMELRLYLLRLYHYISYTISFMMLVRCSIIFFKLPTKFPATTSSKISRMSMMPRSRWPPYWKTKMRC